MSSHARRSSDQQSEVDSAKLAQTSSIPTITSQPMIPSLPSFLDRPPEVRNAIYEALFRLERPLEIGQGQSEWPCRASGTSLLRTCRQIHKEAASVFYSGNEFKVSTLGYSGLWATILSASDWLREIGQHIEFVRHLRVDCSFLCAFVYFSMPRQINLLPLLRHRNEHLRITFHQDTVTSRYHSALTPTSPNANPEALNSLVSAVQLRAPSDLRVYLRCPRVLKCVEVDTDGSTVKVVFNSSRSKRYRHDFTTVSYSMSDTKLLRRHPIPDSSFPLDDTVARSSIWPLIVENLVVFRGGVDWDLDNETITPAIPTILHASGSLGFIARRIFAENDFVATVKSTKLRSDFDGFYRLKAWPKFFHSNLWIGEDENVTISLQIELQVPATLDEVRVEALSLLRPVRLDCFVQVHFMYRTTGSRVSGVKVRLETLKVQLLYLLTSLLEQFPHRCLLPCPALFMDGNAKLRDAQFLREDGSVETVSYCDDSEPEDSRNIDACLTKIGKPSRPYALQNPKYQDSLLGRAYQHAIEMPDWPPSTYYVV